MLDTKQIFRTTHICLFHSPTPEVSETLVSVSNLRPRWSQSRSQSLRPAAKSLSLSLKIETSHPKVSVSVSKLRPTTQKSQSQNWDQQPKSLSLSLKTETNNQKVSVSVSNQSLWSCSGMQFEYFMTIIRSYFKHDLDTLCQNRMDFSFSTSKSQKKSQFARL